LQFTAMSVWLFTGLAVLATGVLAALQYLRIRPRRVRVISTLFWQQAADQAQARTLFERFRHPRTYLLLLAASVLLLLAMAQPVFDADSQPHRVIVLEAGLAMTAADGRFDNALELVRAQASSLDDDRVAVIAADPRPRLIKHFDESRSALENRLAELKASDRPVLRQDAMQVAGSLLAGRDKGEMVLVSAQPVTTDDERVRVLPAGEVFGNAFILSAAFVPDATDLTRGSFECRVGFAGKQPGSVSVKVIRGGNELLTQDADFTPGQVKSFRVSGISADGGVLSTTLAGTDAVSGDNHFDFQLPDRRKIRLAATGGLELPPALAAVLRSLPEVTTDAVADANTPVVRVGPAGSDAQIVILPAGPVGPLAPIRSTNHPLVAGLVFEDALCRAPVEPMKTQDGDRSLLAVSGSPVVTANADATQLAVCRTVFDEDASVVRRTGYMVFWSDMLHRLAGWQSEPLTLSPTQAGRSAAPGVAGQALKADMDNFEVVTDAPAASPSENGGVRLAMWQLLLAAALVLMIVEAVLNIRGRIS